MIILFSYRYLVCYSPFDIVYKTVKFMPCKLLVAGLKEVQRAHKVYHGVVYTAKIYPNSVIIILLIGTIKGKSLHSYLRQIVSHSIDLLSCCKRDKGLNLNYDFQLSYNTSWIKFPAPPEFEASYFQELAVGWWRHLSDWCEACGFQELMKCCSRHCKFPTLVLNLGHSDVLPMIKWKSFKFANSVVDDVRQYDTNQSEKFYVSCKWLCLLSILSWWRLLCL